MIILSNVTKRYDNGIVAVNNVSLRIEQGEFVYLIGPSGSGKSTLMKLLNREEEADTGRIKVGAFEVTNIKNRQIPKLRRSVGVVFQDFKLLPKLNVYENVAYALEVTGKSGREIKKRVMEVLDLVGLRHKIHQYPNELSGGEQQRIAIARAIANKPTILIADEPTGNLDPETALGIQRVLENINQSGTTVLMGTHNDKLVDQFKHRVLRLDAGRVVADEYKGGYHESH
ncbi:cell division ATP-binding protein FtsE [Aerococcaceae bacterium NML191292]|nr:cell division ATP-binding protein FtsE [Aerococcaceae bacterium NML201296]MCW6660365.1 cell division ATP-binding protein FtsE [Aerococcaceae bacterium NML191292]MCW6661607.1 cell division ATP-binding protein FtsE [Aerococcaceae bacterium NML201209]MCW6665573.1 cell division ATP-binding protein FtsE [Aerococcaceae bacterium NML191219]MCW6674897.1 cell division ATP-binding protein FtsE [Aerococcaceae bacterium NML171108]